MSDIDRDSESQEIEDLLKHATVNPVPAGMMKGFADEVMDKIRLDKSKKQTSARWFSFGKASLPVGALAAACLVLFVWTNVIPRTPCDPGIIGGKGAADHCMSVTEELMLLESLDDEYVWMADDISDEQAVFRGA